MNKFIQNRHITKLVKWTKTNQSSQLSSALSWSMMITRAVYLCVFIILATHTSTSYTSSYLHVCWTSIHIYIENNTKQMFWYWCCRTRNEEMSSAEQAFHYAFNQCISLMAIFNVTCYLSSINWKYEFRNVEERNDVQNWFDKINFQIGNFVVRNVRHALITPSGAKFVDTFLWSFISLFEFRLITLNEW